MYNSSNVVLKGIRADFFKQLANVQEPHVSAYTAMVESSGKSEDYLILDAMPSIREWIDQIDFSDFADYKLTVTNKDWQFGIRVDRNTLEDSKETLDSGVLMAIEGAAKNWKSFPNKLISQLLTNGETGLCFDGTAFFANTHTFATFDNLYPGTGVTLAQIEADLLGAGTDLMGFKDKNGEPLNEAAQLVVVSPVSLRDKFAKLRDSQETYIGGSQTNILYKSFDIVLDYRLTGNSWYIVNANANVKPFVYQTRKEPEWVMEDMPSRKYINYISTSRVGASYLNPAAAIKIKN